MLQQNKLLVDFLVIIHTAPVFRSVGPGSSLAGYTIALCLHSRDFCPLAPLYLRCVTGYLRHIMSRGAGEVLQPTEIGMSVVLARSSGFLFIEFATMTQNDDRG